MAFVNARGSHEPFSDKYSFTFISKLGVLSKIKLDFDFIFSTVNLNPFTLR
jgi:hypothetical protein